jgi:hypothetical protein
MERRTSAVRALSPTLSLVHYSASVCRSTSCQAADHDSLLQEGPALPREWDVLHVTKDENYLNHDITSMYMSAYSRFCDHLIENGDHKRIHREKSERVCGVPCVPSHGSPTLNTDSIMNLFIHDMVLYFIVMFPFPCPLRPTSLPAPPFIPFLFQTYDVTEHQMSVTEVAAKYATSVSVGDISSSGGLTNEEAERRRHTDGPNELSKKKTTPWWLKYLKMYLNVLIILLIFASILSYIAYGIQSPRDSTTLITGACFIPQRSTPWPMVLLPYRHPTSLCDAMSPPLSLSL